MESLKHKTSCKTSCFFLNDAMFWRCFWKNIDVNVFDDALQNAKHRANDASNDVNRSPLGWRRSSPRNYLKMMNKEDSPITLADLAPDVGPKSPQGSGNPNHGAKNEESKLCHPVSPQWCFLCPHTLVVGHWMNVKPEMSVFVDFSKLFVASSFDISDVFTLN